MRVLQRAEEEVAKGNLWRAKEILRDSINNIGYDADLFEALGVVLLKMSDLPEAGRFLFLSGVTRPEYEPSIEIFLRRYRHTQPQDFFNAFPRRAKLDTVSEYPDRVAHELRRFGFPERLKDAQGRLEISAKGSKIPDWIVLPAILLGVGTLLVLGIIKLLEILFWLRSSVKALLFNS